MRIAEIVCNSKKNEQAYHHDASSSKFPQLTPAHRQTNRRKEKLFSLVTCHVTNCSRRNLTGHYLERSEYPSKCVDVVISNVTHGQCCRRY